MAEVAAIATAAKDAVDAASGMLDLYEKTINMIIPWDTFDETMSALRENEQQYSDQAALLVGQIQTLLLNSRDAYNSSKGEVNRWCKMAVPVLGQYMRLFELTADTSTAEAQKVLLLKVLNDGSTHLSRSMERLETSSTSFNAAYGELVTLQAQLKNDFSEGSSYYEDSVNKLRIKAYSGAVSGAFFGPIGLAVSYSIAAGVAEGELIPNLKQAFEETEKQFDSLRKDIKEAQENIISAKVSIATELHVIDTMSAKIVVTKGFAETWALIPSILFSDLKKSTTELIHMCNQYIKVAEKAMGA